MVRKNLVKYTDVHGFGVTILMCLYSKEAAISLLRCPAKTANLSYTDISNPLLDLVASMVRVAPKSRPNWTTVRRILKNLRTKDELL